jgi:RND family efflux transporter MFP subunit
MLPKRAWHWGLLLMLLLSAGLLASVFRGKTHEVQLAAVERRPLVQALDEDGIVRSDVEILLAPQIGGRLARILVARGQRVRAGQLLAELELDEPLAAVEQLQAQERAAVHALQQARNQLQLTRERSAAELQVAAAGVVLSRAQKGKVEAGVRPEQVQALESAVQRARLRAAETERDLARRRDLYNNGAVSRADFESYESASKTAALQLREASARLTEARRGAVTQDREVAQAEVQRAEAGYQSAAASGLQVDVSAQTVGEAESRLQAVRAQVRQAQVKLEQGRIRAPRPGVVEWEELEPGEMVNPGQTVLRLVEPSRVYVELLLDEGDRAQSKPGAEVSVTSDAYPGQSFQGKLEAIESQAFLKRQLRNSPTQDEDRVFRARVRVENARDKLFPGMSVFAQVILARRDAVLVVPRQACINREAQWIVYRFNNGRAERRVIETGQKDSAQVEVVKGLQEGDRVVLNPGAVADGALLREQQ